MHQRTDGIFVVNYGELWSLIGGGTRFTSDEVLSMVAECNDRDEPFYMQAGEDRYMITVESMKDYFASNPNPKRTRTPEEEIIRLRKVIDSQAKEIALLRGHAGTIGAIPKDIPGPISNVPEIPDRDLVISAPVDRIVSPAELGPQRIDGGDILADFRADLLKRKEAPAVLNRNKK